MLKFAGTCKPWAIRYTGRVAYTVATEIGVSINDGGHPPNGGFFSSVQPSHVLSGRALVGVRLRTPVPSFRYANPVMCPPTLIGVRERASRLTMEAAMRLSHRAHTSGIAYRFPPLVSICQLDHTTEQAHAAHDKHSEAQTRPTLRVGGHTIGLAERAQVELIDVAGNRRTYDLADTLALAELIEPRSLQYLATVLKHSAKNGHLHADDLVLWARHRAGVLKLLKAAGRDAEAIARREQARLPVTVDAGHVVAEPSNVIVFPNAVVASPVVQPHHGGRPSAPVTCLVDVVDRKASLRDEFRAFAAALGCPSRLSDESLDRMFGHTDEFVADERRSKAHRAADAMRLAPEVCHG